MLKQADLLALAQMVYKDDKYNNKKLKEYQNPQSYTVEYTLLTSTAVKKEFEKNGLQASLIEVKGQKVIAFRGSQGMASKEGQKDWAQDFGLNDAEGYKNPNSQFKDAEKWIASLGLSKEELKKVVFTGHSLGGGLESWAAVKYDAKGVVFSAPSTYNMLTPVEQKKVKNANVTNYFQELDSIPDVPVGVPKIGHQVVVRGNQKIEGIGDALGGGMLVLVGAFGHSHDTFAITKDGQLVPSPIVSTAKKGERADSFILRVGKIGSAIEKGKTPFRWGKLQVGKGKLLFDKHFGGNAVTNVTTVIEHVKHMQKANAEIPEKMQEIYERNLKATMSHFSWILTPEEIEEETHRAGLYYKEHYSQRAVDEVNQKLKEEIKELEKVKIAIKQAMTSQEELDNKTSKVWGK